MRAGSGRLTARCLQEQLWTAEPFHGKERLQGGGRTAGPGGDQEFHFGEVEWGCLLAGQVGVLEDGSMCSSGAPGSLLSRPHADGEPAWGPSPSPLVGVVLAAQSCLTLCDPMDCSLPGSSRLPCPWDFPGKNSGVHCHSLLQGIFPTQGSNPGLLHWQVDALPSEPPGKPEIPTAVAHSRRALSEC